MHDPTTKNRQGGDVGSQYRSAIFVRTPEERKTAEKVIEGLNSSGRFNKPLATTVEDFKAFYSAEEYHQDYLQKNPGGYTCHYWR
jgi:methionine-S-sulfoxide reductase